MAVIHDRIDYRVSGGPTPGNIVEVLKKIDEVEKVGP
jgi:hypothetical protein